MNRFWCVLFLVAVMTGVATAETWPRLNATAADTSYAAPADMARVMDLGDLPSGEITVTVSGATKLGKVRKVEYLADGEAEVSFRKDSDNDWWIVVTMGTAIKVIVSYWSQF